MPSDSDNKNCEEQDELIQREILREKKFSIADAIGREGGNLIKGHSPIPPLDQAVSKINVFIRNNIDDSSMVLMSVLQKTVKNDCVKLAESIEKPFEYLHHLVKSHIENPHLFHELAREVNFKWGQVHNEKPRFQKPGEAPHPDHEYSHENIREILADLLKKISARLASPGEQ